VGAVAGALVVDGDTGLVVAPGDAQALAAAVDRLLADKVLRSRLGSRARQAVSTYTYDAMVEAFDRAISAARSRGRAARGAH
jgi:glycosyltransferase involved in cell wall biosynthesis